jgi:hypothetical protein
MGLREDHQATSNSERAQSEVFNLGLLHLEAGQACLFQLLIQLSGTTVLNALRSAKGTVLR